MPRPWALALVRLRRHKLVFLFTRSALLDGGCPPLSHLDGTASRLRLQEMERLRADGATSSVELRISYEARLEEQRLRATAANDTLRRDLEARWEEASAARLAAEGDARSARGMTTDLQRKVHFSTVCTLSNVSLSLSTQAIAGCHCCARYHCRRRLAQCVPSVM